MFAARGGQQSGFDVLYAAVRLFFFESDGFTDPPWQLDVARFLAPALAAYSIVLAAIAVFGERWDELRLRRCNRHVVICGLGAKGEQLANDFLDSGALVVIIELDPDHAAFTKMRDRRALVVVGAAHEARVLQKARAGQAAVVIAVSGQDGANVATAVHVQELAGAAGRRPDDALKCFVHVVDDDLAQLLQRQHTFAPSQACEVRLFDGYTMTARRFLAQHPLEEGLLGADDERRVHLVIVGFGLLGHSLALQSIRSGHYANQRPLRVTIVDRDAEAVRRRLLWNFPMIEQACDLDVIVGAIEDPAVLGRLRAPAGVVDEICTVAVCFDDDSRSLSAALRVRAALADSAPARLVVRLTTGGELGRLLGGAAAPAASRMEVVVLGTHAEGCGRAALLGDELDRLARAVHDDYVAKRVAQGVPMTDPRVAPWGQLSPDVQDSNRQQADHIAVKLRAIGCQVAAEPADSAFAFTSDEVELLARMEHARWVADRVLAGWTSGPKDNRARRTPYLVPWEALGEQEREWDREPVRNIPSLLARIGRRVERKSTPPEGVCG